ncbi:MAG: hypothetical protein AAB553_05340 [Patescibacteria group bacterium]
MVQERMIAPAPRSVELSDKASGWSSTVPLRIAWAVPFHDSRLPFWRERLDMPRNSDPDAITTLYNRLLGKKNAQHMGEGGMESIDDPDAKYLPNEYLFQFGNTKETRNHLRGSLASLVLARAITAYGLSNVSMENPGEAVLALERRLGKEGISRAYKEITDESVAEENIGIVQLLLATADIRLNAELASFERGDAKHRELTAKMVSTANKFPIGTRIRIDTHSTPTCTFPDGSMVRPVVGANRDGLTTPTIEYRQADGQEGAVRLSEDEEPPAFDGTIHAAMLVLGLAHTYLRYINLGDRYAAANPNVAIEVAERKVSTMQYKEGNVHDVRRVKYSLEDMYATQASNLGSLYDEVPALPPVSPAK